MIRAGNGEHYCSAQVAELVDALVSGISDRKIVEVRVFSWAPNSKKPSQWLGFLLPAEK